MVSPARHGPEVTHQDLGLRPPRSRERPLVPPGVPLGPRDQRLVLERGQGPEGGDDGEGRSSPWGPMGELVLDHSPAQMKEKDCLAGDQERVPWPSGPHCALTVGLPFKDRRRLPSASSRVSNSRLDQWVLRSLRTGRLWKPELVPKALRAPSWVPGDFPQGNPSSQLWGCSRRRPGFYPWGCSRRRGRPKASEGVHGNFSPAIVVTGDRRSGDPTKGGRWRSRGKFPGLRITFGGFLRPVGSSLEELGRLCGFICWMSTKLFQGSSKGLSFRREHDL